MNKNIVLSGGFGNKKSFSGSGGGIPGIHALGGAQHSTDTITNLNTKLTDGTLITTKAAEISALTEKTLPVAADILIIEDAADAFSKKKITLATLPGGPPSGAAGGDLAGSYPNPTVAQVSKSFNLTGVITDTIAAQKDNYNPTGLANASTIQLTLSGDQSITGLAGGVEGRIIIIQSGYTGSNNKLTLKNNSGSSSAANRFYCPLSADFVLSDDNSVILQYDGVQQRWIIIATCQAPYGTASNTICEGNDSRLSNSRTPTSHAASHNAGGGDALAIDAAAATGSLRTIGTGALTACAGNDSRLSDARTPTSHAASHNAGGGDALAIDAAAATGSLRTLGTAATAACAGNDQRLFPEFQFFSDTLRTPVTSEWPRYGSAAATLAADSVNNALLERQFDDIANEGVGLDVFIPSGATSIIFDFYSRAQTAPGSAKQVFPGIYTRQIADNAAPGSFSALVALTAIDIPITNAYWQYDTQTIALSTLSLTAGRLTQILLERTVSVAPNSLVGDWNLQLLRIRFS